MRFLWTFPIFYNAKDLAGSTFTNFYLDFLAFIQVQLAQGLEEDPGPELAGPLHVPAIQGTSYFPAAQQAAGYCVKNKYD
jgi:hypothetical protein